MKVGIAGMTAEKIRNGKLNSNDERLNQWTVSTSAL